MNLISTYYIKIIFLAWIFYVAFLIDVILIHSCNCKFVVLLLYFKQDIERSQKQCDHSAIFLIHHSAHNSRPMSATHVYDNLHQRYFYKRLYKFHCTKATIKWQNLQDVKLLRLNRLCIFITTFYLHIWHKVYKILCNISIILQ